MISSHIFGVVLNIPTSLHGLDGQLSVLEAVLMAMEEQLQRQAQILLAMEALERSSDGAHTSSGDTSIATSNDNIVFTTAG
jgi:hypothetical protein